MQAYLLDLLYPPFCVVCKHEGEWLCGSCRSGMLDIEISQRTTPSGSYEVISLGAYHHPAWQVVLKSLKYQRAMCLRAVLGEVIPSLIGLIDLEKEWQISYIPSDPKRIRERGIEHGRLLAEVISEALNEREIISILARTRTAKLNSQLEDDEQRQANMKAIFTVTQSVKRPLILVDDILTSGATADEAADTLLKAGATEIIYVVFASRRTQ